MSDNSSSANGNSWTILTPEVKESGVESVGPLAEGQGGQVCSEPAQLEMEQTDLKDHSHRSEFTDGLPEQNNGPDAPQVTPLENSEDAAVPHAFHKKEATLSATPVENLACLTSDPEQQGASASHSESEPFLGPDIDSFSDSYTHISPPSESTLHPEASRDKEELSEGEERSELRKTLREESKQEVEVLEEKGNEGDGVRRRKVSLLTPVDHRDDDEEEEGEEEPFRPPQREDDIGFSLNKCIFGAVILLGLGTIFFSENDTDVKELKNAELHKEWLNLQSSRDTPAGVQPPEILERLAEKSQKIAVLQAQLQEQEGELKAAHLQVEEGNKERMRREELEVENQRMKGELDKLPALQKELEQESERVKKEGENAQKDLEALPAMQKELELLRAKVTELAHTTDSAQAVTPLSASASPSAGHERELPAIQGRTALKDKKSPDEVKEWRDGKQKKKDKSVKEGKQGKTKHEGKDLKKQKDSQDESKESRGKGERKEWKGEKEEKRGKKQEDGKRWKDGEENRQSKEDGKRERKENGKRWKDGQEKEFKEDGKRERKKSGKRWKDGEENGEVKKDGKREGKESGKRWKDGEESSEFKKDGKREGKENGKRWKDGEESSEFKKDGKREKENGKRWKNGEESSEFKKDGKREKENGKRWKDGEESSEFKKDGKRGKENGKRWKDGEESTEFKKDGKRERKENGKRWKDGEVKRELKEESGKMDWEEDKKWKKEKRWQLDGGRWETKARKHLGDKVKGDKEWTDEKEWKNRQVGSNDKKEWKERNERKKDWKERDEWEEEKERGNPRGEGKAWKESGWKGQKDDHKRNGGKKEGKEYEDKHWSGKEREWPKDGERAEGWKEEKKHKGDYQKNGEKWNKKDKSRHGSSEKAPRHSYSDSKRSKDHVHDDYWAEQRERIRHFHGSKEECSGVTDCAHAEGLTPVGQQDFEALLLAYLTKLMAPEERASKKEELNKLLGEFFTDGVFVHDQIPFSEFVEDVAEILEDMAEGEKDEELEDEMEGFASEAMEKFTLSDRGGTEEKRKESGRKRASG